jgi:hypothetical protein
MASLRLLDVSHNMLTKLPSSLGDLEQLRSLKVRSFPLLGPRKAHFAWLQYIISYAFAWVMHKGQPILLAPPRLSCGSLPVFICVAYAIGSAIFQRC